MRSDRHFSSCSESYVDAAGVIIETLPPHGGTQKFEELDSAVILGVLYGNSADTESPLGSCKLWTCADSVWPVEIAFFSYKLFLRIIGCRQIHGWQQSGGRNQPAT